MTYCCTHSPNVQPLRPRPDEPNIAWRKGELNEHAPLEPEQSIVSGPRRVLIAPVRFCDTDWHQYMPWG